ncbi:Sensory neuron membrane protein 1 [Eumeta japonica]|uniref:Sensory neuron membrane protein 1 n=1 Tax=Eumeta variegata TaxID=151549 RepID=A0A4C1ZR63_EUMVA|nr:Sensory neuron membrane protein 1 [Eumeta japonica]
MKLATHLKIGAGAAGAFVFGLLFGWAIFPALLKSMLKKTNLLAFDKRCHHYEKWMQLRALRLKVSSLSSRRDRVRRVSAYPSRHAMRTAEKQYYECIEHLSSDNDNSTEHVYESRRRERPAPTRDFGPRTPTRSFIFQEMALTPKTDLRGMWTKIPFALDFKVYLFNYTNPEEIQKGALPVVEEIGPYYFEENVIFQEKNEKPGYECLLTKYIDTSPQAFQLPWSSGYHHAESWLVHSLVTYFRHSRQVSEVIDIVFSRSCDLVLFENSNKMCPMRRRGADDDIDNNYIPKFDRERCDRLLRHQRF